MKAGLTPRKHKGGHRAHQVGLEGTGDKDNGKSKPPNPKRTP